MYDYKRDFSFHVELTDKCNARCPQCARNCIVDGVLKPRPDLIDTELSIADFKKIFEGWSYPIKNFSFCGNFGDPIYVKDILEITEHSIELLKSKQHPIYMHTNGGFKSEKWWTEYGKMFKSKCPNHLVVFSLDGLEDTHHFYRVNTIYETVLRNARAFIGAGGNAEWSFIRFGHNEHQEEEARRRAKEYGFKTFIPVDTQRFWIRDGIDYEFNHKKYRITPATNMAAKAKKEQSEKRWGTKALEERSIGEAKTNILCDVKKKNSIYVDCEGNIHPCCWIGSFEYRRKNFKKLVKDRHHPEVHEMFNMRTVRNAIKEDLTQIMEDDFFEHILPLSFEVSPCDTCARQCGIETRVVSSKKRELIEGQQYNYL